VGERPRRQAREGEWLTPAQVAFISAEAERVNAEVEAIRARTRAHITALEVRDRLAYIGANMARGAEQWRREGRYRY
jgi:hypothetical protein